ncbi:coiled-coil domain-containing protein [Gryllotalpicola reticulitermitis]|uniref:Coiled-coil domain-containing protein n=1 Tax=Gryllotalpicola reticulitermitis TaxID=1184153 RepID=A0ABV8QA72_9MICO
MTIAAVTAVVAALLVAGIGAAPASAATEKWPTQAEVNKAKANASASQAEYNKIQGLVRKAQGAAVTAATVALEKQNDYAKAEGALQQATTTANGLEAKATAAKQAATAADRRLGSITSQVYRSGGNSGLTTELLMSQGNASQLLDRLSAMSRLTGLTAGLETAATQQANVASSLSAQAAAAEKARAKLASQAQTALSDAKAAQSSANSALASSQKQSKVAYQEMAELKHQSAKLQEKYAEYQAYLAALARQRAVQGNSSSLYAVAQNITPDPAAAQAYAQSQMGRYGWDSSQFSCLVQLWTHESGWRVNAYNVSSAAYGIPQAWPGQKMATYGSDWMTSYVTQINWGLDYIRSSYGTPCAAWSFELSHTPNWY